MSSKVRKEYGFYCCYLLRSVPRPKSFYIGSTPDPVRRLRQHNGLITSGAYRTKRQGFRPWCTAMVVYGFPNKISALMFEHAWQHAYQTRHIAAADRITKSKGSGSGIHHRVSNVRLLLKSEFFQHFDLQVQIFDQEVYNVWCANRFKIALDDDVVVDCHTGGLSAQEGNYSVVQEFMDRLKVQNETIFENLKDEITRRDVYQCDRCTLNVDVENELFTMCYHCFQHLAHIVCMSRAISDDGPGANFHLLPRIIKCSKCAKKLKWLKLVEFSKLVNGWLLEKSA